MGVCKYWRELDDDRGMFENCSYRNKHGRMQGNCTCAGSKSQCNIDKYAEEERKK